jgi:hypothetical protein
MYHSPNAKDILHFIISFNFLATVAAASHLRGEESHHDESRGLTSLLLQLPDPKSVVNKSEISGHAQRAVGEWKYPLNPETLERPLRILTFGASTTWGASLDNRHQAYPWLLGEPYIDYVDKEAASHCQFVILVSKTRTSQVQGGAAVEALEKVCLSQCTD